MGELMSDMHDDTVDPAQGIHLGRRGVLIAALFGAGAVVLGAPRAALAAPGGGPPDFEVAQPGLGDKREWVHLKLDPNGTAEAVPLTIAGGGYAKGTVKVSNSTGFVTVATGSGPGEAEHSVECAIEAGGGTVWVTPRRVGSPGIPADRLLIESGSGRREIDVWVEPVGGVWGGTEPLSDPIALGITAIHAALLPKTGQTAEVAMFSIGRDTDDDGNYIPSRLPGGAPRGELPTGDIIPGQWQIDVYEMHRMEARALQLSDYSVTNRRMADPMNIFCGGHAQTADGLLMHAGGHMTAKDTVHDANLIHLYDPNAPENEAWQRLDYRMEYPRWYPTLTALPDGKILIASGSRTLPAQPRPWGREDAKNHEPKGFFNQINNDYLVVDPASGKVEPRRELIDQQLIEDMNSAHPGSQPGASLPEQEGLQQLATYPAVFVLPGHGGGTVLALVESNRAWLYTYADSQLERTGQFYQMNTLGSRSYPTSGSIVMLPFRPAQTPRILALGGQHENTKEHRRLIGPMAELPATNTAEIFNIDTSDLSGTWTEAGTMARRRVLCDATLLADGQVLVSGGSTAGWGDVNEGGVLEAEIYNPEEESPVFRPAGEMSAVRRYHSTAVLLPDGTMLKAGSTGGFGSWRDLSQERYVGNYTGERYFPAYCFRPRPAITGVNPERPLPHGAPFTVTARGPNVASDKAKVALIRPGSTTHGNNMDQRYVWLDHDVVFTGDTAKFTVTMPAPAAVPPGMYMLVVVFDGTPSEAYWVKVPILNE